MEAESKKGFTYRSMTTSRMKSTVDSEDLRNLAEVGSPILLKIWGWGSYLCIHSYRTIRVMSSVVLHMQYYALVMKSPCSWFLLWDCLVPRPCPVFCCLQYGKVTHVGRDDLGLTTKVMSSVVLHNHSKMTMHIRILYTKIWGWHSMV